MNYSPNDEGRWARLRRRLDEAARSAARVQAAVLLTLVYWIILGPIAAAARLLGADLLALRRESASGWIPLPRRPPREILKG